MNGHLYAVYGVVNGKDVHLKKLYSSRNAAIDGMFKYLDDHFISDIQVEEEVVKEKHTIEYVCNHSTRFTVARA